MRNDHLDRCYGQGRNEHHVPRINVEAMIAIGFMLAFWALVGLVSWAWVISAGGLR